MLISEAIRVGLFVSAVGSVYAAAGWLTLRQLHRRLAKTPPAGRGEVRIRRVALALAGLGLLCMAYGRFVEPYWLEVTHVRLQSPKLPAGTRPIRIVHFSDLHSDPRPRLEDRLPEVIAAEKPDLIVFTGDAINMKWGLPVFRACMEKIARVAPTFAVRGNWDTHHWKDEDLYGGTGVRLLEGEAVEVEAAGVVIRVAGAAHGHHGQVDRALAELPAGVFTVFLHHVPDKIYPVARRQVDLYCAGHTHGGQVALPLYGALVTFSRYGKRFERGLHRVDGTWLYVNRGIGMEGVAPRVRFCARPELTVIEVAPRPADRAVE